jgi:hypothetical protein
MNPLCTNIDCINPVSRQYRPLCRSCGEKRRRDKTRKRPFKKRCANPFEAVVEAAIALADAVTDADYDKAKAALRWAAGRWVKNGAR